MKGEKLSFSLTSLPSPIRECDFRALFSGEKIVIPSFTMMTGESSLKGKGELRGWNGLKGDLTCDFESSQSLGLHSSRERKPGKEEAFFFRGKYTYPGELGCSAGTVEENRF